MNGWALGIDFGTSYTVAAIADANGSRAVDLESGGRDRMPSAVFLTEDGEILVGTAAQHQAKFAPERYEPTPKRTVPDRAVFLGDRLVSVEDLIAAVLRRAYTEACRQQGERAPAAVRLTHPADWSESRLKVLREAIARAGVAESELVPEPVAAAVRIALQVTAPDRHIAVYDFGGGTFDAAVLLRTPDGFEIAGPPAGRDPLGGEDIDQRIIGHLGELLGGEYAEQWSKLLAPADAEWRGLAAELRSEVQQAKETLSDVKAAQLWIPGIRRDVQITRDELNELIEPDIDATLDALEVALEDAQVAATELAGLYLVGGSSRIPLVADKLWRRIGVQPAVQDNPKLVVATGAATWTRGARAQDRARARPGSSDRVTEQRVVTELRDAARRGAEGRFSAHLTAQPTTASWPQGCRWAVQVLVDRPFGDPLTLRLRDDPGDGRDTGSLASEAQARRVERTPGFREGGLTSAKVFGLAQGLERRFTMTVGDKPVPMFERYLALGMRALILVCPETGRAVADGVSWVEGALGVDAVHSRFELTVPDGWTVSEQLTMWQDGTERSLVAERVTLPGPSPADWQHAVVERLRRLPQSRLVDRAASTLMNAVRGEVITAVWRQGSTPMVTKLGVAVSDGVGLSLMIALPLSDQDLFRPLAGSVSLLPAGS